MKSTDGKTVPVLITVAIPCYRSTDTLPDVVKEIRTEFAARPGYDYQLVLVNDGSPDATMETIRALAEEDDKIIGVDLSRNYSQENARMAAFSFADGDAIVFMDDDGQHPAAGIFALVERLREGYDVAYAVFRETKNGRGRHFTSRLHARMETFLGQRPAGVKVAPFAAMNRFVIEKCRDYHAFSPNISAYLYRITTRFANVEMDQRPRLRGKSKYTSLRRLSIAWSAYTDFTLVPVRIAGFLGALSVLCGIILGICSIAGVFAPLSVMRSNAPAMATVLIVGGIVMLILGIVGEYVGKAFMSLTGMPQFTVRNVVAKKAKDGLNE